MQIQARAFRLWKAGNSAEEYEDACWPEIPIAGEMRAFRCAVADGATETSFAAIWARMLVRAYCRRQLTARAMPRCLPALQASWHGQAFSRPLPWYAEEKVRCGAFSAVAGLTLAETDAGLCWSALAVGDSCVFQVREDTLACSFPIESSAELNSRPHLLGSVASHAPVELLSAGGDAWLGDLFLLMTDALAGWFLAQYERGELPWRRLYCSDAFDGGTFEEWIGRLRAEKEIRNDDVTLLSVRVT